MLANRLVNSLARLSLLLLALLLPSCSYPGLKKPLSDLDEAKPDKRLFGVWRPIDESKKERHSAICFIGKSGHRDVPQGIMKCILAGIDSNDDIIIEKPMYFFTTSVGDNSYGLFFEESVFDPAKFPRWDKRNIKKYTLFKYKVEEDRLNVWLMETDAVEAAIRKGQVEGTVVETKKHKIITLTGGENLSKFLADGGDKVFFPRMDGAVLTRVK
jgi:hypothetical protein